MLTLKSIRPEIFQLNPSFPLKPAQPENVPTCGEELELSITNCSQKKKKLPSSVLLLIDMYCEEMEYLIGQ